VGQTTNADQPATAGGHIQSALPQHSRLVLLRQTQLPLSFVSVFSLSISAQLSVGHHCAEFRTAPKLSLLLPLLLSHPRHTSNFLSRPVANETAKMTDDITRWANGMARNTKFIP
jgi:hypothetical protein